MHVPTSSIGTVCNLPVSPSLPASGKRRVKLACSPLA
ncbi:hypothetical protein CPAR01_13550, partial [Colletotrichum paranaense]